MKLRQRISSAISGFLGQTKGLDWARQWLAGNEGDSRGGANLLNAYLQSVWVYSCVNALAQNVAETQFKFSSGTRKGETEIISGPLFDLFQRPHPRTNRFQFWELYVSWLCLRGEAFIYPLQISRTEWQILVLNPDNFIHIIHDHELIGWRYTGSPTMTPLPSQVFLPEEIIHDRLPNPFNFWRGASPLQVGNVAAQTDYAAAQFMKGLMLNNADTGVIVTTDQQLTEEEREYVLAALRDRKRMAGTADRPLLLFAGAKVEKPSLSSTDMQFLENRKFTRQEICAIYGVPQELLGFTEDANRSVSDSARLNFTEHRIAPLCERIEAAIDPVVKKIGGPNAFGFFDVDTRPIMQQARNSRVDIATKYFGMGVPLNEINKNLDLGLPEFPWGNTGYLPFSLQPVNAPDAPAAPNAPNAPPAPGTEVPQQDGPEKALRALGKLDSMLDPINRCRKLLAPSLHAPRSDAPTLHAPRPDAPSLHAPRSDAPTLHAPRSDAPTLSRSDAPTIHSCAGNPEYEASIAGSIKMKRGRMQKFFFEQRGRILAQLQTLFASTLDAPRSDAPTSKAHDQRLDQLFNLSNENTTLKQRLKPVLIADLEFGGAQLFAELGLDSFKLPPEKAIAFLAKREKKIEEINQTTFDDLKASLSEGLQDGETFDQLADRVKAVYKTADDSRAETVASTETNTAVNAGRLEGMKEAKVERKGWAAAKLPNVRATHLQAEREYSENGIAVDQPFIVGGFALMHPSDPSGPPQEVINCRCFSFAIIPDKGAPTLHAPRSHAFPLSFETWLSSGQRTLNHHPNHPEL